MSSLSSRLLFPALGLWHKKNENKEKIKMDATRLCNSMAKRENNCMYTQTCTPSHAMPGIAGLWIGVKGARRAMNKKPKTCKVGADGRRHRRPIGTHCSNRLNSTISTMVKETVGAQTRVSGQ